MGASLAAVPLAQGAPAAPPAPSSAAADDSLVKQMRSDADGDIAISRETSTGAVSFIRAKGRTADLLPNMEGDGRANAVAKADAYLGDFAAAFGARPSELVQTAVDRNDLGTTVTYVQKYQGVEVFASRLKANFTSDGALTSVNGFAVPDLKLSVTPRKSASAIEKTALGWVRSDPPTGEGTSKPADLSGIKAAATTLVVYRTGALKGEAGESILAYTVEVSNRANIREMLIFDANTGKLVNRYSMVADALDRELYENSPATTPVWTEGDPLPGDLNGDQQNLVNTAGDSYWLYFNAFGRDSYDAEGAPMLTVNNDPRIRCPNANWNGATTNYCDGVTSDDVVSHEWGHAYTEYTSGLIYQYQAGALSESYSDVWGETVDLINGRDDAGEMFDAKRPDGECDPTADAGLTVVINSPADVAGPCQAVEAAFGDGYSTTPEDADVQVATDDDASGSTTDGCAPFTNAADIADKYAYVDRGACPFQTKVTNAEAAGATGIIIGNNVPGDLPYAVGGDSSISGFMVTYEDGLRFKSADTSNVSIAVEDPTSRTPSTRWLIGEKTTAFGGAIRDMWTPTCYGHPGKVTDAEYRCDPTLADSGGVHSNSGVPNHAYALTVDGGDYNGQTMAGIGLDKAAAIWFRAQTNYLTPGSNFVAAADGLEASCADLIGQSINTLTTTPDATPILAEPITASDCGTVTAAITATEMRTPPAKCDFQPLLEAGSPAVCGEGFTSTAVYSEDFEDGLAGWDADQKLADLGGYRGGFGAPWEATSDAPGNHRGGVAYGPAGDTGDCSGDGENDFSSADFITGPSFTMPSGTLNAPRLSFEHYVALEGGYDGGNVQVSLNGADFAPIPADAYTFNAPGEIFTEAAGNTNPLAGQDGFTGTDGGEVTGSWGESQVDLEALGVASGDTMQLRLAVGRDGCGGVDGWYVDNLTVSVCDEIVTPPPPPATYVTNTTAKSQKVVKFGKDFKVRVKVRTKGFPQISPRGRVKIFTGGSRVGFGKLDTNGKVKILIRKNLIRGERILYVRFHGNKKFRNSHDVVNFRIF
ncbi:M4 family metallopeptidase [Nocardioides salsibiostraticola]